MRKNFLFCLSLLVIFSLGFAYKPAAQSLSAEEIKAQMVADWERAKEYTMEYLKTMPAEKYSAKVVDSIRSFAQQMLHLAVANVFLMYTATGEEPLAWAGFGLENSKTAQNRDSVVYYVMASYDFAKNAVQKSDISKWGEKVKFFNMFEGTRFAFMNKTFEHQTHHRGQTTMYIRNQDIVPPQEKLF